MRILFATLFLMLVCSGCGVLRPGIQGSGRLQSQTRHLEAFHEVDLSGTGTVNLQVGGPTSVQIATDDNLLEHIETRVTDGTLKISSVGPIRPRSGLNVNITVPELTATRVSGAGTMNLRNLSGDSVELTVSGAGSLTADGYVKNLRTRISGAGDADLRDLVAHTADVKISGAGDATVYAIESLSARVSGAGDVTCYGNPAHVHQQVSGAGDINLASDSSTRLTLNDQPSLSENQPTRR